MKALLTILLLGASAAGAQENSGLVELATREELRGFEPVGRVDIENGGFCTGALIAADLVLTAAHCVLERDGTPVDASRILFRAGFSHGTALAEVSVARTIADPDYRNISPAPLQMIERDVALLQLAEPIPSAVISPFTVARSGNGDEVSVVSYAEDRADALSWQQVCKVIGREGTLIGFDCDVTFGSSGAPVFRRTGGRVELVSLVSGGVTEGARRLAFGMELPKAVAELKAALRRGDVRAEGAPAARVLRPAAGAASQAPGGAKFLRP